MDALGTAAPASVSAEQQQQNASNSATSRHNLADSAVTETSGDSPQLVAASAWQEMGSASGSTRPWDPRKLLPFVRLKTRLYLRNLHPDTTAQDVVREFSWFGQIEAAYIAVYDPITAENAPEVTFRSWQPRSLGSGRVIFSMNVNAHWDTVDVSIRGRRVLIKAEVHRSYENKPVASMFYAPKWLAEAAEFDEIEADALHMGVALGDQPGYSVMREWTFRSNIHFSLDHHHSRVTWTVRPRTSLYRFSLNARDLRAAIALDAGDRIILLFDSTMPAMVWVQLRLRNIKDPFAYRAGDEWRRVAEMWKDRRPENENVRLDPTTRDPRRIHLGHWTAYALEFTGASLAKLRWVLRQNTDAHYHSLITTWSPSVSRVPPSLVTEQSEPLLDLDSFGFDFSVRYLLECLISSGHVPERRMTQPFLQKIKDALQRDDPHNKANRLIMMSLEQMLLSPPSLLDPAMTLQSILQQPIPGSPSDGSSTELPRYCCRVNKIIITPTRILPQLGGVETTNRVLRRFFDYTDRFLRVEFTDEDGYRVSAHEEMNMQIHNRIFKVLQNGIYIAGRFYEFLAFSASQLREHSCWFFAPIVGEERLLYNRETELLTNEIRAWMGDFSQIKTSAKCAARMGQCFSNTRFVADLPLPNIQRIPDVEREGYVFSDGVGRISRNLLDKVASTLRLSYVPSAIQFRLGGAKGMLALDPSLDDDWVLIRPSQAKFDSFSNHLEVVRASDFMPCFMNRQVITLITSLGVGKSRLLELKDQMVKRLDNILTSPGDAFEVLGSSVESPAIVRKLSSQIRCGLLAAKDVFLQDALTLLRAFQLRELKQRTRINVPKGVVLLGVMDELSVLKADEIFVQFVDPLGLTETHVLTGKVLVTRNPCLHPGDVQVFTAVDVCESLGYLNNLVVFPQVGERDIPSMLSGGDLDGDTFMVVWDPELIPTRTVAPMVSQPVQPEEEHVTIEEIKKFFVNYITYDNLGMIANAHLALADKLPLGPHESACLRLAQMHSTAVDFAKSGVPTPFPARLRPEHYPDFMGKDDRPSYRSESVIGKIYRSVELRDFVPSSKEAATVSWLLVDGYESFIQQARRDKFDYDAKLRSFMHQHRIRSEMEFVTGLIVKYPKTVKKEWEIRRKCMEVYDLLEKTFRKLFDDQIQEIDAREREMARFQKASAWYYVTYSSEGTQNDSHDTPFVSFPWVVFDVISEIASKHKPQ